MRNKLMFTCLFLLGLAFIFDTFSTIAFSTKPGFWEVHPGLSWWLEKSPYYFAIIKLVTQFTALILLWHARKRNLAILSTILLLVAHIALVIWHIALWRQF